jgi:molybdopterin converting factor small subunit
MKVRVLFFGATADEVGERQIELSVNESANAQRAFAEVVKKFPKLQDHKLLFAVNQEYVSGDRQLKSGDELAIFTAVSGG